MFFCYIIGIITIILFLGKKVENYEKDIDIIVFIFIPIVFADNDP